MQMSSCFNSLRSFGSTRTKGNINNKVFSIKSIIKRDFKTFNNNNNNKKNNTKENVGLSVNFVPKLSVNSQNYLKKYEKEKNFDVISQQTTKKMKTKKNKISKKMK